MVTLPEGYRYQNSYAAVLPYLPGPLFREDFLVGIYFRCKQDKILRRMLPGFEAIPTLDSFIHYMHTHRPILGIRLSDGEVYGIGWVDEYEKLDRRAAFGFAFFKDAGREKIWGTPIVRDVSRMFLEWWFRELDIDVLYGTTLKDNGLAKSLANEMGFTKVGDLPSFFPRDRDATLLVLKRDEFFASLTPTSM